MISNELDDLLSLFAAAIIADKRVFAQEVDVFLKATSTLKIALDIQPNLSEARILSWYEMNKDAIREEIAGPYFRSWLYDRLDRLAHIKGKQGILDILNKISLADGELHSSESALMSLTAHRWELDIPR